MCRKANLAHSLSVEVTRVAKYDNLLWGQRMFKCG